MKKIDADTLDFIKSGLMGLFGLLAWYYSKSQGTIGEGMVLAKTLSIMFMIIGIGGVVLNEILMKKPIKKIGKVNNNDEMFRSIRAKAAKNTLDIFNVLIFLFIIITATEILNIKISLYWLGMITFVTVNVLSIITTYIQSNKLM